MIDASQVTAFAAKLNTASVRVEQVEKEWASKWGGEAAKEMRARAPVLTGALRDSISATENGAMVTAPYARFVEHGTSRQAPQPFIEPSLQRIRQPATQDLGERVVRTLR